MKTQILAATHCLRRQLADVEATTIVAGEDEEFLAVLRQLERAIADVGKVVGIERRQAQLRISTWKH